MPEQRIATVAPPCAAGRSGLPLLPRTAMLRAETMLGPGDRLRLRLIGDTDRVTGTYVIGDDGMLALPGLDPVVATGTTLERLQERLTVRLRGAGIAAPQLRAPVDLRLIETGGVSILVSGAVFDPGTVRAGDRPTESRVGQKEGAASGDTNPGRSVASALRAAGGIRPDADLGSIGLIRAGTLTVLDLRASMAGAATGDVSLASGDRIVVPSTGCFDAMLVRPSLVTAPGIRVYMSNLSRPASNNASAAIGKDTTSLPYGTRLLQGLVAMNCVGGSAMNAGRRAVLISRNPMTGVSVVIERRIELLVRGADRDAADPYLMPGDAIACYDSRWTNLQEAISLVSNVANTVTPAILLNTAVNK
ncbi:hypothetical protein HMP09_2078 [Sphingomonas sp. HMP9]|nr:hypothetical protein HMP09_2078 [Sphingomonas sp. HMP9]